MRPLVTMSVVGSMVNGHNTAHGGMVFSLADSAFAFACNSHNRRTVAAGLHDGAIGGDQERDRAVDRAARTEISGERAQLREATAIVPLQRERITLIRAVTAKCAPRTARRDRAEAHVAEAAGEVASHSIDVKISDDEIARTHRPRNPEVRRRTAPRKRAVQPRAEHGWRERQAGQPRITRQPCERVIARVKPEAAFARDPMEIERTRCAAAVRPRPQRGP